MAMKLFRVCTFRRLWTKEIKRYIYGLNFCDQLQIILIAYGSYIQSGLYMLPLVKYSQTFTVNLTQGKYAFSIIIASIFKGDVLVNNFISKSFYGQWKKLTWIGSIRVDRIPNFLWNMKISVLSWLYLNRNELPMFLSLKRFHAHVTEIFKNDRKT